MKCERFTVGIGAKTKTDEHYVTVYIHPNIDTGTKIYNYREFKHANHNLSVLSEDFLKFKGVSKNDIETGLLPYTLAGKNGWPAGMMSFGNENETWMDPLWTTSTARSLEDDKQEELEATKLERIVFTTSPS